MNPLTPAARRLREELGLSGLIALALLAAAAAAHYLVVKPLEERNALLAARLVAAERHAKAAPGPSSASEKLWTFYRFLEKGEDTTDWLAKLYGIGLATGVELRSANYRAQQAGARMERYEIVLPVTGSYREVREFLKRSLDEIPVLSLDQLTLRRDRRTDDKVRAEVRLTLHRVKS
jgi:hypothetical protein